MSDETGRSGVGSLEVPSSESAVHSKYSSGSTNGAGPGKKVVIKSADMKEDLQKEAVDIAIAAFEKYSVEKEVAEHIKKMFDKKHGPTWHCIVGKNFGNNIEVIQSFTLPHGYDKCSGWRPGLYIVGYGGEGHSFYNVVDTLRY